MVSSSNEVNGALKITERHHQISLGCQEKLSSFYCNYSMPKIFTEEVFSNDYCIAYSQHSLSSAGSPRLSFTLKNLQALLDCSQALSGALFQIKQNIF